LPTLGSKSLPERFTGEVAEIDEVLVRRALAAIAHLARIERLGAVAGAAPSGSRQPRTVVTGAM